MGQAEIIKTLDKFDRAMSVKEIAEELDMGISSVSTSMLKLLKRGEVTKKLKKDTWLVPLYTLARDGGSWGKLSYV